MVSQHALQQVSRGGGGCLLWEVPASCGGVETPQKADGYCCRRYVSYWKAFLLLILFNYRPQQSCGQGYVFIRVCDSVHGGVSASVHAPLGADTPPGADTPRSRHPPQSRHHPPGSRHPPESRLQHTVNERPVRILLECILVNYNKGAGRLYAELLSLADDICHPHVIRMSSAHPKLA